MRTRSQPQSPGGLVSLDDKPKRVKRARAVKDAQPDEDQPPAKRLATKNAKRAFRNARAKAEIHDQEVEVEEVAAAREVKELKAATPEVLEVEEAPIALASKEVNENTPEAAKPLEALARASVANTPPGSTFSPDTTIISPPIIRSPATFRRRSSSPPSIQLSPETAFGHFIPQTPTPGYTSASPVDASPSPAPAIPRTPATGRSTIFGNMFGTLSRSVSRIFSSNPTNASAPPSPLFDPTQYTDPHHSITKNDASIHTTSSSTDNADEANSSAETPYPEINTNMFMPKSEPRPRRSLFDLNTPRSRPSHRRPATTAKPRAPALQARRDPRQQKVHLWKLNWERVPLNRLDPLSVKKRAEEAQEAGINEKDYNIYDPGYEPSEEKTPRKSEPIETANTGEKRKRPELEEGEAIPNPPGVSYGMDLRYFDNSSDEDEDEDAEAIPQGLKSALKQPTETSFERFSRSSKRVKFDNSPIDTPSKQRAREKYVGLHFADSPNAFLSAEDETSQTPSKDTSFTPSSAHPTPNTFRVPDEWSDESSNKSRDSSGMSGIEYGLEPGDNSTFLPEAESTSLNDPSLPQTPVKSNDPDLSPLSKARKSAERYKPKSPSRLSQSQRIPSSSPSSSLLASNDEDDDNNEFAKLPWPKAPTMAEAGMCDQDVLELVNFLWTPEDDEGAEKWWDQEFERFKTSIAV